MPYINKQIDQKIGKTGTKYSLNKWNNGGPGIEFQGC
jgi:hypothetical protein